MTVAPVTENSANKANYDANASDLDRAIEAISELKAKDPAAARKIDNLEAQYEQAIRLRRMRIETLESHISDRDDELVEYRRHMERHYTSETRLRLATKILLVMVIALAALVFAPSETFQVAQIVHRAGVYALDNMPRHPAMVAIATALISVGITLLIKK